eukprot:1191008-Prorocentrum_minimum.AAC.4
MTGRGSVQGATGGCYRANTRGRHLRCEGAMSGMDSSSEPWNNPKWFCATDPRMLPRLCRSTLGDAGPPRIDPKHDQNMTKSGQSAHARNPRAASPPPPAPSRPLPPQIHSLRLPFQPLKFPAGSFKFSPSFPSHWV